MSQRDLFVIGAVPGFTPHRHVDDGRRRVSAHVVPSEPLIGTTDSRTAGLDKTPVDTHHREVAALRQVIMARPIEVKALSNFRIWLRYDDNIQGEVDLSDLAGRGVFKAWDDAAFFRSVRLGSHGAIEWGSQIDVCPDAMYLRLTGKSPDEIFPSLRSVHADA